MHIYKKEKEGVSQAANIKMINLTLMASGESVYANNSLPI